MLTFGDLRSWDSTRLDTASSQLRGDLKVLERAKDELETQAVPKSWVGLSGFFADMRRRVLLAQVEAFVEDLQTFERAIFTAAPQVGSVDVLVTDIDTDAKNQEFTVGADGSVQDVAGTRTFDSQAEADAWTAARTSLADALVTRIEGALDVATQVDSDLFQGRPDNPWNDEAPGESEGTVDPVVEREWSQMSDDERREVLENIAHDLREEGGIEDFEVKFEDLEDEDGDGVDDDPTTDSGGYWSEGDRELVIDLNDLDDPAMINTVAHEVRHAQQNKAIEDLPSGWDEFWGNDDYTPPPGTTRAEVEEWEENFDDYQSTDNGDTFEEYWEQPVEVDARDAGADYLDDYTPEDLEEHR